MLAIFFHSTNQQNTTICIAHRWLKIGELSLRYFPDRLAGFGGRKLVGKGSGEGSESGGEGKVRGEE